jgi:glycosyltransferase involved in cell wall biosynthesis
MRILMVGPGMLALKRPLDWALAHGHEVCLVGEWNPYRLKTPANYRFVEFVTPFSKHDPEKETWIDKSVEELQPNVEQLRELAATFQPDIIHAHPINHATLCCVLADLHPLVVSAWGFLNYLIEEPIETQTIDSNSYTECEKIKLDKCVISALDALVVENPALVAACQNLLSSSQRIECIPLGTKTDHFHPNYSSNVARWRQVLKIPDNATVFLSPRGWGECYCQEEIFQAYAKAYPDLHKPAILLFIKLNRDSNDFIKQVEEKICTQAKTLGIADTLRYLPELPHEMLPTAYNLADLVINYPDSDAFPSTLVEAASCQRPVITSDLLAYRDTFVEEYCTLVEPRNPEALAKAMLEVVQQSSVERSARLVKAGQHIIEQYDETVTSQKLMNLYQELALPKPLLV